MRKVIMILSVISTNLFFGQSIESYNVKNVFPVNPETASLAKYKETEVSKFTGIPNISINLYNVKSRNIQFPISISYNSAGIRVNEIASQIGLGWTIFSGGEISRIKRGTSTDDNWNGFIHTTHKCDAIDGTELLYMHEHQIDTEPDEFNLNLPNGKNVKFYFSQDQTDNRFNIITFPFNAIKVTPVYYNTYKIISWIVLDTDGTKYEFGTEDNVERISNVKTYTFSGADLPANTSPIAEGDNNYISSWKLTKITKDDYSVDFSYRRELYNVTNNCIYQGESFNVAYLTNEWGQDIQRSFVGTIGSNLLLEEINTDIEKIKFNAEGTTRLDLSYSKRLKDIEIISKINNQRVKKYVFDTDYFVSNDDYIYNSYGCQSAFDQNELKRRLYLKRLIEINATLTDSLEYKFDYYDDVILPHRNSYAQDYWGFYNGKVGNMSLMPSYVITKPDLLFLLPQSGTNGFSVKVKGADRTINPSYTNACMLKSITYPEKGITEFIYENNKTSKNTDIKKNLIDFHTLHTTSANSDVDTIVSMNSTYYKISKPFTLAATYSDILGIDYKTFASNCIQDPELPPNIDCSRFNIKNLDTNEYIFLGSGKSLGFDGSVANIGNTGNYIVPGNYILEMYIEKVMWDSYTSVKPTLKVDIEWGTYADTNFSYFGGLRIKEIKNYTSTGTLATMKKYSYLNAENKESGDFINLPIYKSKSSGVFVRYPGPECDEGRQLEMMEAYFLSFSSSPMIPLHTISGNALGYTDVREEFYDFSNPANSFSNFEKYSFTHPILAFEAAPVNEDWTRGQLLTKNNNVIEEEYKYADGITYPADDYIIPCYDRSKMPFPVRILGTCASFNPHWVLFEQMSLDLQHYNLLTNLKSNLMQKKEKLSNVVATTDYEYSTGTLLASEKKYSSTNETLETKYFYPQDVEMVSEPFKTELIAENMIGTPLVTQNFRNSTKIFEKKTIYADDSSTSGLLLPKNIQAAKFPNITGNLENKVTFDKYDNKGNITQYSLEGGMPVTIIWGYLQTQPIAKIENATNAQVATAIGMTFSAIDDDDFAAIDALRTSMPNAMITTYTYKPSVGVSTITDPKGDKVTYTYDDFGRLEKVLDKDENILTERDYHYKN
jgi:YD repeat-containing protein